MSVDENDAREGRRIRYRPRGPAPARGAVLLLLAFAACESTTVAVVDVERVEVRPAETSVVAGGTTWLAALVQGPEGRLLDGWPVSWSSSDEAVATVDAGGVTGHREGTVLITARVGGVSGSALVEVLPGPEILPDRSEVTFAAPEGGHDPPGRNVAIANGGAGQLTGLSVALDYSEGHPGGWLSASLADTRAPTTLRLRATTGALQEKTYAARVILRSPEAGQAVVQVSFVVGDPEPRIALDRSEVQLEATQGKPAPDAAEIRITNAGGQSLTGLGASVDYQQGGEGWLTAGLSPSTAPATLRIRADHDALAVGMHLAVVKVFSAVAANSPREVTVRLVVFEPDEPENEAPKADFTADCTLLFCSFQDRSEDTDGEVEAWDWDFGDGSTSSDRHPDHTYLLPGTYIVSLEVIDDDGAKDQASRQVTVSVSDPNEPPVADFEVDCDDLECEFEDKSRDDDGSIVAREWSFGDGNTATRKDPKHQYDEPGTYVVRLKVTDNDGATDSLEVSVTVDDDEDSRPAPR